MLLLEQGACVFPDRLHPVSAKILEYFMQEEIPAAVFLRFFSLPNSDYIPLAACIVKHVQEIL